MAILVPCFNEQDGIAHLAERLRPAFDALTEDHDLELLLVNDGSTDNTSEVLARTFADWPCTRVVAHDHNRGIAAATLTGMRATTAEIVATLDADCTYDPLVLIDMLRMLAVDVDVVTASPYHPAGEARGVPAWRLRISRCASWSYRRVFRNRLHTYTSCCRVYRATCLRGMTLRHDGFVGITELLWRLDRAGSRIVECPAVLCGRRFGHSKMRVLRVAMHHLTFLGYALLLNLTSTRTDSCLAPNPAPDHQSMRV